MRPFDTSDQDSGNPGNDTEPESTGVVAPNEQAVIFVPTSTAHTLIRIGSAIVSTQSTVTARIVVDVEDGRYTRSGYADCVAQAHGRHVTKYPTIARFSVPAAELHAVGTYDASFGIVTVTDQDALCDWLGTNSPQLETSNGLTTRRREWRTFLRQHPDIANNPQLRRSYARSLHIEDD